MKMVITPSRLERLRLEAKRLKKEKGIQHTRALDEIAAANGWHDWKAVVAALQPSDPNCQADSIPHAQRARWYVHGDESEDSPGRYFCEDCDRFESGEHFKAAHGDDSWRCSLASLERWRKLPMGTKLQFRRSDGAVNLFDDAMATTHSPPASQHKVKRVESSGLFQGWLNEQEWRPDAVGDFARAVALDPEFPVSMDDVERIRQYLRRAPQEHRDAFEEAWEDFLEAVR